MSGEPLATDEKSPTRARPKRRRKRFSVWRFLLLLTLGVGGFGAGIAYWGYREFSRDLPERWSALTEYRPPKVSRVFSSEGELIG